MRKIVAYYLVFLFTLPVFAQDKKEVLVIFEVEFKGLTPKPIREVVLTDAITDGFAKAGNYNLVDRDTLYYYFKQIQKKSQKPCEGPECLADLAAELDADLFVKAEVNKSGSKCSFSTKLYKRKPNTLLYFVDKTESENCLCQADGLTKSAQNLGRKLSGRRESGVGPGFVSPGLTSSGPAEGGVTEVNPTQVVSTASGPAGLYITTSPSGADVYLGNLKAGNTDPAFQKTDLEPGKIVQVTLQKSDYHPLVFPVDLKPGVTKYEGLKLKPNFGSLEITSEPSGAKVEIGGAQVGTTPYRNDRMKSGVYLVSVLLDLYHPVQNQTVLIEDGKKTTISYPLSPNFGSLEITSDPSGAKVEIGGESVGITPYRNDWMKSGEYLVSVSLDLYDSVKNQMVLVEDEKKTLRSYPLSPNFGTVSVESDPVGAGIFINDAEQGKTPGLFKLLPGQYELSLKIDGYHPKTFKLAIARGKPILITKEQGRLIRMVGSLSIFADPPEQGAKVFLDGREKGTAPLTLTDIPVGSHEIIIKTISLEGNKTILIEDGKMVSVTIKLEESEEIRKKVEEAAVKEATEKEAREKKRQRMIREVVLEERYNNFGIMIAYINFGYGSFKNHLFSINNPAGNTQSPATYSSYKHGGFLGNLGIELGFIDLYFSYLFVDGDWIQIAFEPGISKRIYIKGNSAFKVGIHGIFSDLMLNTSKIYSDWIDRDYYGFLLFSGFEYVISPKKIISITAGYKFMWGYSNWTVEGNRGETHINIPQIDIDIGGFYAAIGFGFAL